MDTADNGFKDDTARLEHSPDSSVPQPAVGDVRCVTEPRQLRTPRAPRRRARFYVAPMGTPMKWSRFRCHHFYIHSAYNGPALRGCGIRSKCTAALAR